MPTKPKHIPVSVDPLIAFLRDSDIKQAKAAEQLGLESSQVLSNWKTRGVPSDKIRSVAKLMGITSDEYLEMAGAKPLNIKRLSAVPGPSLAVTIDVLNIKASGATKSGFPAPEETQVIDRLTVSARFLGALPTFSSPANLRVITAFGDSMKPTINPGDMLIVDIATKQTDIDGIYVLQSRGELYIKRIKRRPTDGKRFLISDNNPSGEPPEPLTGNEDNVTLEGRVVWRWRGEAML